MGNETMADATQEVMDQHETQAEPDQQDSVEEPKTQVPAEPQESEQIAALKAEIEGLRTLVQEGKAPSAAEQAATTATAPTPLSFNYVRVDEEVAGDDVIALAQSVNMAQLERDATIQLLVSELRDLKQKVGSHDSRVRNSDLEAAMAQVTARAKEDFGESLPKGLLDSVRTSLSQGAVTRESAESAYKVAAFDAMRGKVGATVAARNETSQRAAVRPIRSEAQPKDKPGEQAPEPNRKAAIASIIRNITSQHRKQVT